jgi:(p)ppGpp synthase/HD superfamily hydrolase
MGQKRKYSTSSPCPPYVIHPAAVADIVRSVDHTEEMLAAAWLHDVVEDCGVAIETIAFTFGESVSYLVGSLTDVTKTGDGNRAFRVAKNREHSARGDERSQTIKMADIIHNSYRIFDLSPKFAPVYWDEKRLLVAELHMADPHLKLFQAAMRGRDADDFCFEHASSTTLYLAIP